MMEQKNANGSSPNSPVTNIDLNDDPLLAEAAKHQSVGVSRRMEDNVLPLIRLLQSNSPEVGRRNADYVEGAAAGDWYFRDAPVEIVKGEAGFLFIPLRMQHCYVEWKPERGGFAGRTYDYFDPPKEVELKQVVHHETGEMREMLTMPNGNYLEETFYIYGIVDEGVDNIWVLTFRSTGLTVARRFNSALKQLSYKEVRLPIWGSQWRFTTRSQSNKRGEWFIPHFTMTMVVGGGPNRAAMTLATLKAGAAQHAELASDLETGKRQLEPPTEMAMGVIVDPVKEPANANLAHEINDVVPF